MFKWLNSTINMTLEWSWNEWASEPNFSGQKCSVVLTYFPFKYWQLNIYKITIGSSGNWYHNRMISKSVYDCSKFLTAYCFLAPSVYPIWKTSNGKPGMNPISLLSHIIYQWVTSLPSQILIWCKESYLGYARLTQWCTLITALHYPFRFHIVLNRP